MVSSPRSPRKKGSFRRGSRGSLGRRGSIEGGILGGLRVPLQVEQVEVTAKHSTEDAEGMLNILLLMSTLMLSFAITFATASFMHDDFLKGDQRNIQKDLAWNVSLPDGSYNPQWWNRDGLDWTSETELRGTVFHSRHFFHETQLAIVFYVIAITLGVATYVSLCYSDAREDPDFFESWFRVFKFVILLAYIFFMAGMAWFVNAQLLAVEMIYPKYCLHEDIDEISNINDIYNSTTSTIIESAVSKTCDIGSRHGVFYDMALSFRKVVFASVPVVAVLVIAITILLNWLHYRKTKKSAEQVAADDIVSEMVAEVPTTAIKVDPRDISVDKLLTWTGMEKHRASFEKACIDDEALFLVSNAQEFASIGIPLGDALKLVDAMQKVAAGIELLTITDSAGLKVTDSADLKVTDSAENT